MKKLVVLMAGLLLATPAMALIDNSAHDIPFSVGGGQVNDEVCVFCHTPHGANTAFSGGPLWNRAAGGALTGVYSSATLNASIDVNYNNIDASACISCHDGSQTMGTALQNPPNTVPTGDYSATLVGDVNLGLDMSNDHPVSFNYDAVATADNEIRAVAALPTVIKFKKSGAANIMQCSSCHDVHNTVGERLILINNAGSNLCLACHIK